MSTRIVILVVAGCAFMTNIFLANMCLFIMIGEINRKRQEGNLASYFGFTFPKTQRIFVEYRALYPSGKMHIYALLAFAIAMTGLIGVAGGLGFFG